MCHLCQPTGVLYLKVKRLNGIPVLVIGELAKKRPLLLQVFVKSLKRAKEGGKALLFDVRPGLRARAASLPVTVRVPSYPGGTAEGRSTEHRAVVQVCDKLLSSLGLGFFHSLRQLEPQCRFPPWPHGTSFQISLPPMSPSVERPLAPRRRDTYKDGEVFGRAGDGAVGRQGLGHML